MKPVTVKSSQCFSAATYVKMAWESLKINDSIEGWILLYISSGFAGLSQYGYSFKKC